LFGVLCAFRAPLSEVVIRSSYDAEAIAVLQEKKNRIILIQNEFT
jgi:AICAR transformylase/IMP cyclohydrolase PurH